MPGWIRATDDGCSLSLLIQPRAPRSRVVGEHDGRLKVQVSAPPVDGEANSELITLLSEWLGVPRRSVAVAVGETGRRKTVRVVGLAPEEAARRLEAST